MMQTTSADRMGARELNPALVVALYVVSFLVLEWATYIPAYAPLGITPWNPSAGLAFAVILMLGWRYLPFLALPPLFSDLLIRRVGLPFAITVIEIILTGLCYAAAVAWLRRRRAHFSPALISLRDLALLGAVTVASAAIVASVYVGVLVAAGYLPASAFGASAVRYWVGDVIGITVVAPFVLLVFTYGRLPSLTLESGLQAMTILAAIAFVLGSGSGAKWFYLLFLPIAWVAVRSGLEGVSAALVLMQVGIMATLHLDAPQKHGLSNVTEYQVLLLMIAFTGLAIGIFVSDRARTEQRLRLQQDALAQAARRGSYDKLSTAIAHEINQPLTAIANYARAAQRSLEQSPIDIATASEATRKVVDQVERAAEVVRRLRDLIRFGRVIPQPHALGPIIAESIDLMRPDLLRQSVHVEVVAPRQLPLVSADLLQIEQVLTNLIRNAAEAMDGVPEDLRQITITARARDDGMAVVTVRDTGPGFPAGFRVDGVSQSPTSKPDGLGIGLTLCQSIIEAHGGRLEIHENQRGGAVSFTLRLGARPSPSPPRAAAALSP